MAAKAVLAVEIVSDATKGARGFAQMETSSQKFERRMGTATKAAGGTLLAIGALGAKARNEASSLQQSSGAVEAAFGRQAKAIKKASRAAAGDLGLAKSEYQQMAAVLGSQLSNLGTAQDQLVPKTKSLIQLGGDLAATFGGKTSDAVEALSSLMRGERDPIERYGVSIKQADIEAQLLAKGQGKLTGAARKQAEAEATLALLTKQTAKAQGQRRRETGSDAQAAEVATAKMKNAFATLGAIVLPVTAAIATSLADVAGWVDRNQKLALLAIGVVGTLAAAVLVLNGAYKAYKAVQSAVTAAQLAFNVVMAANPVVLVVLAVIALGAAFVLAYKKSETFRTIVQAVGRGAAAALGWIVDKAKAVGTWITKLGPAATKAKDIGVAAFKLYTKPIQVVIDLVEKLIGWLGKIKFPKVPKAISSLGGLFGGEGGPDHHPRAVGGSVPAQGRGGPGGGGFSVLAGGGFAGANVAYIQINGVIDSVSAGREVEKVLRRNGVRLGRPIV